MNEPETCKQSNLSNIRSGQVKIQERSTEDNWILSASVECGANGL